MAPVHLLGGGLSCAMGSHARSCIAGIAAGLSRLGMVDSELMREPFVYGSAEGGIPFTTQPDRRIFDLLRDAVDGLLEGPQPRVTENIAMVVGWPHPNRGGAPPCPSARAFADLLGARMRGAVDPKRIYSLTGETAGGRALALASRLLSDDRELDACFVAAADSWLSGHALRWLSRRCPLRRTSRGEGIVPAEAGAAVWVVRAPPARATQLLGTHVTRVRGSGAATARLEAAIEGALNAASRRLEDIHHVVLESGTNAWGATECRVAMARLGGRLWSGSTLVPAGAIGHVGAAAGVINALLAAHLLERHGRGGTALCVINSAMSRRVALVLGSEPCATRSSREQIPWSL